MQVACVDAITRRANRTKNTATISRMQVACVAAITRRANRTKNTATKSHQEYSDQIGEPIPLECVGVNNISLPNINGLDIGIEDYPTLHLVILADVADVCRLLLGLVSRL